MGHFDVALVIELIHTSVEDDFESIKFRCSTFLLISKLVDQLSKSLVVIEVAFVVAHV